MANQKTSKSRRSAGYPGPTGPSCFLQGDREETGQRLFNDFEGSANPTRSRAKRIPVFPYERCGALFSTAFGAEMV